MPQLAQYDGIIFDYGGVLVHHQTPEDIATMAGIAGIAPHQFSDCYWLPRQEYDGANLSATDYWKRIGSQAGVTLTQGQVDKLIEYDTASWMVFDEVMWAWVEDLRRAGKRVAILSNMPLELGEALKVRTNRFCGFDHLTLSYEIKTAKPDAPIYHHCLAGIGTDPARTLFLDDRLVNVEAAQALGIKAIEFTSRDAVLPKLLS